jgi:hypothetical protein
MDNIRKIEDNHGKSERKEKMIMTTIAPNNEGK